MVEHLYGVIPVKPGGMEPQFLIVQHQAGHWGFPKGHPEPGETATKTATRELFEETNVRDCTINDQVFFTEQFRITRDDEIVFRGIKYFLGICHDTSTTKASGEIVRARWVTKGEGLDILTFQTTKDILLHAHEYLQTRDQNLWN